MTISIAMASYNGAAYLEQQLQSFAVQTRMPDELVIADDGSTDDTAAVVARFASSAPFAVQFVANPQRLGYNRNFAHAIALTRGDIVFISDQDDVWYADKIARVAHLLENDPRAMVAVNDQQIADGSGREVGRTVLQNIRALGKPDNWYGPGCCIAFRRGFLEMLDPFPGDAVAYDHWINALADAVGARRLIEAPLQSYRRHESNTSGSVFALAKPGAADLVRAARAARSADMLGRKLLEIDTLVARLDERRQIMRRLSPGADGADARSTLAAEREAYARRLEVVVKSRVARLPAAALLYLRGGYRAFSGLRTALKDMLVA